MPNIEQGTTATIPSTGNNAPTSPHSWEILRGGAVIAHNANANGWNVTGGGGNNLTVTCPPDAVVSANYEARFGGGLVITPEEPQEPQVAN